MLLNQKRVQELLIKYSLKFPQTMVFHKREEILEKKLPFPCVLKVDSPSVVHKTELGLVFTHIDSIDDLQSKINEAEITLTGKQIVDYNFILQESVKGTELIFGMKTDPTFGKVIVFGLGGIFVEIMKEVSMRIAPLERKDCLEMLESTKASKLLDGFRGFPKVNKEKIVDILMKISKIAVNEKNIVEIDFNPVIVNEKDAYIADARIISDENA